MTAYWFRPKKYGYGATPITWQGWLLTLAPGFAIGVMSLLGGLVAAYANFSMRSALAGFLICVAVGIAAAIWTIRTARRRTDGEWRWRWGNKS